MDLKDYKFKSKYEINQALWLAKHGIEFEYETIELRYVEPVRSGECTECGSGATVKHRLYTPDFFFPKSGIIVETKGKFDAPGRAIIRNVLASHPDIDLRIVFQRDNWLTKKKKHSYTGWAESQGIQCAVGNIPIEWFNEE
jgi:hypothetical protein